MRIHFLKSAWRDIILLQEGEEFAMIDAGLDDQFPMIRDYLDALNVRRLSFVLLTHFHVDHYGGIPDVLRTYEVQKVYLKEYSALESIDSYGRPATAESRAKETETYHLIESLSRKRSELVPLAGVTSVPFGPYTIRLFNSGNTVRRIYEDGDHPDTCGQYCFSENMNSLGAVLEANGAAVFFGGDLSDVPAAHPLADRMHYQIAKEIGRQVDLYKAPHHGTVGTALPETLAILRPRIAVITNGMEYLSQHSDVFERLRTANPDVQFFLTEKQHVIADIAPDGSIRITQVPA